MKLTTEPENGDDIVYAIDLMQIKTKVDSNEYTSLYEFLVDFQWFVHNFQVMYKSEFHSEIFFQINF